MKGRTPRSHDVVKSLAADERTTSWLRELGVTSAIELAVFEYEREHNKSITAGLATRVFHAIDRCGGIERIRTMTRRDLLLVKNIGPGTVKALIDLGLCKSTATLMAAAFKLDACSDPEISGATHAFLASAIEWRQHVELYPSSKITQTMLDKLDELIGLLCQK